MADRTWLQDVEQPEQQEGECLPQRCGWREEQHQQERNDLVPYHRLMIRHAEIPARPVAHPDARQKQEPEHDQEAQGIEAWSKQPEDRQREQRAESARRGRRKPRTETERDKMGRMCEQEAQVRPSSESSGNDQNPPPAS